MDREILNVNIQMENEINVFDRSRTLALIDLYKKWRPKVGSGEIRTNKKLWEVLASQLSALFGVPVTPMKCENRWKVLERNYKKCIDNNSQTGRGFKKFEFEKELDDIYGKKNSVRPMLLLGSNTVCSSSQTLVEAAEPRCEMLEDSTNTSKSEESHIPVLTIQDSQEASSVKIPRKKSLRKTTGSYTRRNEILLEMKNDLKEYYKKKLRIQEEKLALEKDKVEDRLKRTKLLEAYLLQKEK